MIPDLFVWRDVQSDSEVLFSFDHGYGGGTHILPNGTVPLCGSVSVSDSGSFSAFAFVHLPRSVPLLLFVCVPLYVPQPLLSSSLHINLPCARTHARTHARTCWETEQLMPPP